MGEGKGEGELVITPPLNIPSRKGRGEGERTFIWRGL
jgi:hypothetical protein